MVIGDKIKVKLRTAKTFDEKEVYAQVIKINQKTCWVELPNGNIIKRRIERDCVVNY